MSGHSREHVVVTGGGGFVGSHLTEALLEDGYAVSVLDNFASGRPENLAHLGENPHLEVLEHDVKDPFPAFDDVSQVYHFASRASPADFADYAVDIALTNGVGTIHAYEFAREMDARVILASTSEVYGDPEVNPQPESYHGNVDPRGLRAPYDEGKRFAEALTVAYQRKYDLDVRTARIFNTYGPRMRTDDGRVVPNFLTQAMRGEDLTVYGDGSQTRCFCYVSDLIRGIRRLAELPPETGNGAVVNLGSTEEITIETLAEAVFEVIDSDSGVTHEPLPENDPQRRRPDLSRAEEMLEWEPTVSLREGLARTAEALEADL